MSHPEKMTKLSLPLAAPLEGGIGGIARTQTDGDVPLQWRGRAQILPPALGEQ